MSMPEHERAAREALNEALVMCAWAAAGTLTLAGAAYGLLLSETITAGLLLFLAGLCAAFALIFADSHAGRHESVVPPGQDQPQREEE